MPVTVTGTAGSLAVPDGAGCRAAVTVTVGPAGGTLGKALLIANDYSCPIKCRRNGIFYLSRNSLQK